MRCEKQRLPPIKGGGEGEWRHASLIWCMWSSKESAALLPEHSIRTIISLGSQRQVRLEWISGCHLAQSGPALTLDQVTQSCDMSLLNAGQRITNKDKRVTANASKTGILADRRSRNSFSLHVQATGLEEQAFASSIPPSNYGDKVKKRKRNLRNTEQILCNSEKSNKQVRKTLLKGEIETLPKPAATDDYYCFIENEGLPYCFPVGKTKSLESQGNPSLTERWYKRASRQLFLLGYS